MKKLFILTLISICTSIAVCSAADIEVKIDNETGAVSVCGSPGEVNAEKKMMLYALKEGDVPAGLNPDETQKETEIFSAIEYCEAEIDGDYSFPEVQMRSADGRYIFYVTADHSDIVYQSEPLYVISKSTAESLRDVFENKNAASIKNSIKSIKIDAPILNLITDDGALGKIAEKLADKSYESNDAILAAVNEASFKTVMETPVTGAVIELLLYPEMNESMKEYADPANSVNLMSEKSLLSTFKVLAELSSARRIKIFDEVSKAGYTGSEDMFDKINMNVIMSQIKSCPGYGDITGILSEHRAVIEDFSYSDYSTSRYLNDLNKTLMKKSFTKTKELSGYITKYLSDRASASSSGGGSGSGSSGTVKKPSIPSTVTGSPVTPPSPVTGNDDVIFSDINGFDWASEAINNLAVKGVLSGKGDKKFAPGDNVKREEFVKMLVLAFDLKSDNTGDINFTDVDSEGWYVPYIKTAYSLGIVNGVSEDSFGIGSYISRQDMAVMITRAKNIELTEDMADNTFTDSEQVSDYARQGVGYLKKSGVINGYEDGSFKPFGNVTRAETAKVLYGLLK